MRFPRAALLVALASAFLARAPEVHATEPAPPAHHDVSARHDARPARMRSPEAPRALQGGAATTPAALGAASLRGAVAGTAAPVEFDRWRGLGFGSYLAPKSDFVAEDGGVDVVFHFHAGQMAERQMKESGMNAVFVSCGFGIGSGAYADAFASPQRFGRMLDELMKSLEAQTGKKGLHVRHLALASWSAGFASVGRILGVERYYAMVDAVVLNDSLHAQYKDPGLKTASQGADRVDLRMMRSFVRFAKDASDGKKAMVITHSAIIPPDYASSTEATAALLAAVEVPSSAPSASAIVAVSTATAGGALGLGDRTRWRGMNLTKRADSGNLHVRGFSGGGPRDHFEHLHLLGDVLQSWVVPRWKREERLVYTLAGE